VKVSVVRKLEAQMIESDDDKPYSSGYAVIAVKDDGAGISSINLSRLFQEGIQFNANELQKGGGSGFGLYIAKGIVDLHMGSRMWAESEGEGMGATFFVKLPLSDVVLASPKPQSIIYDVVDALNDTLPPLVILVVDDSPINRRLTIQLLKQICGDKCTCTFLEADDGQEAVSCVTQSLVAPMLHFAHYRPAVQLRSLDTSGKGGVERRDPTVQIDIVFMDYNMPRMVGYYCTYLYFLDFHLFLN
jgi:CheY-like chemotaxis protein